MARREAATFKTPVRFRPSPPTSELRAIKDRKEIPAFLSRFNLNTRICEVGVAGGGNLSQLLKCKPLLAVAVDYWHNGASKFAQQYAAVQRLAKAHPELTILRELSPAASGFFPDNHFDFIYIDANHIYECAAADLKAWWPKVRPGGLLAGHDYCEKARKREGKVVMRFGVKRAVDEFRQGMPASVFHTTTEKYPTWLLLKP